MMGLKYDNLCKTATVLLVILLLFLINYSAFKWYFNDLSFQNNLLEKHSAINEAKKINLLVINYFNSENFKNPEIEGFIDEENSHMKEVKLVIGMFDKIFYFLLIIFFLLFILSYKRALLKYGGLVVFLTPLILLLIPFDVLFDYFHMPFFTKWQYPESYLMVQVYTIDFFKNFAMAVFFSSSIAGLILFISSFIKIPENFQKKLEKLKNFQ